MKTYFYIIYEKDESFGKIVKEFQRNKSKTEQQEIAEQCFLFLENQQVSIKDCGITVDSIDHLNKELKQKLYYFYKEKHGSKKRTFYFSLVMFVKNKKEREFYIYLNKHENMISEKLDKTLKSKNYTAYVFLKSSTLKAFDYNQAVRILKDLDVYKDYKISRIII